MAGAGAAIAVAFAIIGGAVSAAGYIDRKKQQEKAAETNIALAELDIEYIEKQTKTAEERFRDEGEAFKGTQKAVIGHSAAKTTEGTPLLIQQETAARIEQDVLQIKEKGKHEVERLEIEKEHYAESSKQAFTSMILGLGSTFLTSYAKMYRPKTKMPTFGHQNKPYQYLGYPSSPYGYGF